MLSVRTSSCRDCALINKLIGSIDCQLAKMANNLYLNIAYMLDKPVYATDMSTLLHYKRILTYKNVNADWAADDFTIEEITSRIKVLTAGCKCCDEKTEWTEPTTTTTTTTV